jgi:AcrR family transcriptional regulator
MPANVVTADKAVNDNNAGTVNTDRYASPAMTATRPYHHGNLREALLREGERALETGGAGGLSLRELARAVGVSHAAPRRHFPEKQALLDAMAEGGFARLGDELGAAITAAGPRCDDRLAALARAYVGFARRHAALLELMFAAKHEADAPPELREAGERAFAAPLAVIAAGQAAGEVVAGDPEHVAMVAFATMHGLVSMANAGMFDDVAVDAVIGEVVERLVLGLRPR